MEYIDINRWKRKEHFKFFENVDVPKFDICMNLDVTHFKRFVKENNLSFYFSMVYATIHVMNGIDEFLYKIRDGKVIRHEALMPSFTDLEAGTDLFKIVSMPIGDSIIEFSENAKRKSKEQTEYFPKHESEEDELVYISCIPWISFTSMSNELVLNKNESIPRITFGKYFTQGEKTLLPYSIQVNHRLLDGYHVGKYIEKLQKYLDEI